MSLQLNVSNSLHELAQQLANRLKEPAIGVFQPHFLVTQTDGMNNWLTIRMADQLGISANCRFLKPNDMVNQLYYWLGGETQQVLGADHLQWLVYNLLATADFADRYPLIANYYQGDEVKRIALARKIADLFDQYQVYRPDMVDDWNKTNNWLKGSSDWQQYTWAKVKEHTGESFTDKTSVIRYIINALQLPGQQERLYDRLPAVHIFGVSIITHFHIQLFHELGKYIAVNFYLLNPAPLVYWLEDKTEKQLARLGQASRLAGKKNSIPAGSGNQLLLSWGKVIQETFGLLFENDDFLNNYNEDGVRAPAESANTLLKKIQQDIFYNHDAASRSQLMVTDISDGSFTVNACYTPVREVEVLYNYLVHLVEQPHASFSPRDIVVMVSDIDAYAPYIKAIFNTAKYHFPITIADESVQSGDTLFTALAAILALSADSFKAEEVMQLLDSAYIRNRFQLTDTELIRKVVNSANIRFGITGHPEDDTFLVSWAYGLQRILYGICMSGCTEYTVDEQIIFPLDMVEGAPALELVRFNHFIEILTSYVKARKKKRTLADWGTYIHQLVENLVFSSETNETAEDYQRLLQYIENLNLLTATYNETVSFEVFKHSFLDIIATATRSASFASGGITFCSLIPMRSIPFKVVALLGMNFDKFPRRETPLSFDLMVAKRRRGDRNVKDNDKHLFLETILSAQEYLYISFIGRSAKDNSVHPPSALVDELVDYVEAGMAEASLKVRDQLITLHPMHGFSQQYFGQSPRLYSYLGEGAEWDAPAPPATTGKAARQFQWEEIEAEALLRFFDNPFKWYYNKVLSIYYSGEEVLLPDTEVFELDGLQAWKLKNDLLYLNPAALPGYQERAVKTGLLPLKNMGAIVMDTILEAVTPAKTLFNQCTGDAPPSTAQLHFQVGETLITGRLQHIYNNHLLVVCFSKNKYKHLLKAYLTYVLARAGGYSYGLNFLSATDEQVYCIEATTYTREKAVEMVTEWLANFKAGHEELFLFYPGFTENPLKLVAADEEKFFKMVANYMERTPDEYLLREFGHGLFEQVSTYEGFINNTEALFSPLAEIFPALFGLPNASKQSS